MVERQDALVAELPGATNEDYGPPAVGDVLCLENGDRVRIVGHVCCTTGYSNHWVLIAVVASDERAGEIVQMDPRYTVKIDNEGNYFAEKNPPVIVDELDSTAVSALGRGEIG